MLPASDQYSLGAVLYEAASGQPPFLGPPSYVLFHAIHDDPPSPGQSIPEFPGPLHQSARKPWPSSQLSGTPRARNWPGIYVAGSVVKNHWHAVAAGLA